MTAGFISEMIGLPIHGGGVTLERVLGKDLRRFDWFAETIRYRHEEAAVYPAARSHSYGVWPIQEKLGKFLGCTLSHRIASHPSVRKSFAVHVARQLMKDEPSFWQARLLVCPQAEITLLVLEELRKHGGIEYVTWMMDDHLVTWREGAWCYPDGLEDVMRRHLAAADQIYVISHAMRDFYRERFGVESTVLSGPASLAVSGCGPQPVGEPLRLVYFGSLGRWQNDAISLLASFIAAGEASLDIYSHNPGSMPPKLAAAGAAVRGGIAASEVSERTAQYDAVVLPVSFLDDLRNMSYFNVATKFSECLAAPIPTLLIGPDDSAMVRIARSAGACAVVEKPCRDALKAALDALRAPEWRSKILAAEHALLAAEFSEEIMRGRWLPAAGFLFGRPLFQ